MAFLSVGLLFRGAAAFGWAPYTVGVHLITVGAIGCLTLGMMARVALGHTGRPLVASRRIAVAFVLLVLATVLRATAGYGVPVLAASGWLFTSAFLLYLWVYGPILWAPRADGRPG